MKKIFYLVALAVFSTACGQAPKTSDEAQVAAEMNTNATIYTVNSSTSTATWEGAKITQSVHRGTVQISEGMLSVNNGQMNAGSFTIDMNSIVNLDLTEETGKSKLEGHLKSADFFDVATFPTAKFEITRVEALSGNENATHSISGNLTIKGITNSISFPAKVSITDAEINANAKFEINRNEWNVVWGGSKTEQSIKDYLQNNLIKDTIVFEVAIMASK